MRAVSARIVTTVFLRLAGSRSGSRQLGVFLLLGLLTSSASAFRAEPGNVSVQPAPARQLQAVQAKDRTPLQASALAEAEKVGVEIDWQASEDRPASIRGADLGRRQAFSGGKGLRVKGGGAVREDSVAVLDNLSSFFRIQDAANEFAVKKVQAGTRGSQHVRMEQTYRGLKVVGRQLIVHFNKEGAAYEVNGQYEPDLALDIKPKIAAAQAVMTAQADLQGLGFPQGELAAQPEVVVYARRMSPTLAFELTLSYGIGQENPGRWRYWIDATQGTVLARYNDIKGIAPPTIDGAPALLSGNILPREGGQVKSVLGWLESTDVYYMHNPDLNWYLMNDAGGGYPDAGTFAHRMIDNWGRSDPAEMSGAVNVNAVQQYYRDVLGRNSWDGVGGAAPAYIHYGTQLANAYWSGTAMLIGDGDGQTCDNLGVIDVFAHEYTHAVTDATADLIYQDESGALNESFSDIFGVCAEFYSQADGRASYPGAIPGQADWLMGEDCWVASTALRDMRDPANVLTVGAGGQLPSRYKGSYWYSGMGDNGGVHYNCAVQSFCFYLLCEGGIGTNDGFAYNVTGIGITNAEQIAYRALTEYCTPDTDYRASRLAWISAANAYNPALTRSVKQAWNAVFSIPPPVIVSASTLPVGRVGTAYLYNLGATGGVTPLTWDIVSGALPANLTLTAAGKISGVPEADGFFPLSIAVTDDAGRAVTNQCSLTILPVFGAPYTQNFDSSGGQLPSGWAQETISNHVAWTFVNGNGYGGAFPASAHSGAYCACFEVYGELASGSKTRLISPRVMFDPAMTQVAKLTFWHVMTTDFGIYSDELKVLYKTSVDGAWQVLADYPKTKPVTNWTKRTLTLPGPYLMYYVAFEGTAWNKNGVFIDDVDFRDPSVPLAFDTSSPLPEAIIKQPYSCTLTAKGGTPNYTFRLKAGDALPTGLTLSTNGVISGTSSNLNSRTFGVVLTDSLASNVTATFSLTVAQPRVDLFAETFENQGVMPAGWTQAYVTNNVDWVCRNGGGNADTIHQPTNAYQGSYNAVLWVDVYSNYVTRLVSPEINLGAAPVTPRLTFWHCMTPLLGDQDELRVFYRTSATSAWVLLTNYTASVTAWTQRTLPLPETSSTFYVAFEGLARFGQGVCVDDIRVTDGSSAPIIVSSSPLKQGQVGSVYSNTLSAVGGVLPYAWEVVAGTLPSGLVMNAEGLISGLPAEEKTAALSVRVVGADGFASTNLLTLKVTNTQMIPYTQNFDQAGKLPFGWSYETVFGESLWQFRNGGHFGVPAAAHSASNCAVLISLTTDPGAKVKLVSPKLNLGAGEPNTRLSFWFCMAQSSYQDELKVYYKTNVTDAVWTELAYFKKSITAWTNVVLTLPRPSSTYVIAFEGYAKGGNGVCVDDVQILDASPYGTWKSLNAVSDDNADPDGDGIVNALEYAMGLDPLEFNATGTPVGGVTAGYLTLTYRENLAATDLRFEVEACASLAANVWSTNGVSEIERVAVDGENVSLVTKQHNVPVNAAPSRFLRLKVYLP